MKTIQQLELFKAALKIALTELKTTSVVTNQSELEQQANALDIPFYGCDRDGLDTMLNTTKHKLLEYMKSMEVHQRMPTAISAELSNPAPD